MTEFIGHFLKAMGMMAIIILAIATLMAFGFGIFLVMALLPGIVLKLLGGILTFMVVLSLISAAWETWLPNENGDYWGG